MNTAPQLGGDARRFRFARLAFVASVRFLLECRVVVVCRHHAWTARAQACEGAGSGAKNSFVQPQRLLATQERGLRVAGLLRPTKLAGRRRRTDPRRDVCLCFQSLE